MLLKMEKKKDEGSSNADNDDDVVSKGESVSVKCVKVKVIKAKQSGFVVFAHRLTQSSIPSSE